MARVTRTRRLPADEHARERLRAAQQRESAAVAAVYAANDNVAAAQRRLAEAIVAHEHTINDATKRLQHAQAELVAVSGLDRAALLLAEPKTALRAACKTANDRPSSTVSTGRTADGAANR